VAHGSTTIEYVHDALGRRVGRVVNGVFERGWLYKDSLNPIAQVNAAGVVEATYVYVTRANVPDYIVTTAGAVYRVVSDHLGSVRMLVNATTGAVVERYDYDVWGRVTFESGDHSLHPFGYAGGLYDADTGWCASGCATTTRMPGGGPRRSRWGLRRRPTGIGMRRGPGELLLASRLAS
jgi:uncharacterized protein RhaS with RHS repeats